ncbi:MAG: ABC transporter ATP-binding protein [Methanobacteriota archaeon]
MIEVSGLTRRYGRFAAVEDLTFRVREGEIFGLVGPNGAGKTTTLKILAGVLEPSEGDATIRGASVRDPDTKRLVGYLAEESPVYEELDAYEYLRFFGSLYGIPRGRAKARATELLDLLGLDHRERALGAMSKGMRRKVAIARSLLHDPPLLLYDEPGSGLDPLATAQVVDTIRTLRDEGHTIVFSAHNLHQVEAISDDLLILHNGKAVAQGTMGAIREAAGGKRYEVYADIPVDGAVRARPDGPYVARAAALAEAEALMAAVRGRGGRVLDVSIREPTLEEIFLKFVRK